MKWPWVYMSSPSRSKALFLIVSSMFLFAHWGISALAALKSLSDHSHEGHLSVGICRLTFFGQFETLLVVGVMSEFRLGPEPRLLCSEPFGVCVLL